MIRQEDLDALIGEVNAPGAGIDPSSGNFGSGLSPTPLGYGYGALGQIPGALAGIPGMFARGGTPDAPPDLNDEQGLSEFIARRAIEEDSSAMPYPELMPEELQPGYEAPQDFDSLEPAPEQAALTQALVQGQLSQMAEREASARANLGPTAEGDVFKNISSEGGKPQFYQGPEHLPVGDVGHVPYGTGGVSGEYDANIKRIPGRSATVRPGRGTLSMSEPAESIPQHPEEKLKHFQQKAELAQAQAAQEQFEAQKRESELPAEQRAALAAARLGKPAPSTHPAELLAAQLVQAGLANGEITSIEDAIAKLQAFQSGSIDLSGFDTTPALPPAS